jgi:hypothetical protein
MDRGLGVVQPLQNAAVPDSISKLRKFLEQFQIETFDLPASSGVARFKTQLREALAFGGGLIRDSTMRSQMRAHIGVVSSPAELKQLIRWLLADFNKIFAVEIAKRQQGKVLAIQQRARRILHLQRHG